VLELSVYDRLQRRTVGSGAKHFVLGSQNCLTDSLEPGVQAARHRSLVREHYRLEMLVDPTIRRSPVKLAR
jgi:hypothetical protein